MTAAARAIPLESGADISTPAIKRGLMSSLFRDTWLASSICICLAWAILICQPCSCCIFTSLIIMAEFAGGNIGSEDILTGMGTWGIITFKNYRGGLA